MTSNPLKPKMYDSAEDRAKAFEDIAIEIMHTKDSRGLAMDIYQVQELINIYQQAEGIQIFED